MLCISSYVRCTVAFCTEICSLKLFISLWTKLLLQRFRLISHAVFYSGTIFKLLHFCLFVRHWVMVVNLNYINWLWTDDTYAGRLFNSKTDLKLLADAVIRALCSHFWFPTVKYRAAERWAAARKKQMFHQPLQHVLESLSECGRREVEYERVEACIQRAGE